jgi:hypothetical protein
MATLINGSGLTSHDVLQYFRLPRHRARGRGDRSTRTAAEPYREGVGVCRDFAHLAITFCRCMNIPARYCTGYLGDNGVPPVPDPMDFSGWFEAYLGGCWYTHSMLGTMCLALVGFRSPTAGTLPM